MWCDRVERRQKLRGLLCKLLSRLLATSGYVFWKIEQKLSTLYNRNIFLLYRCCTAEFK
jgi:hypothetical protein